MSVDQLKRNVLASKLNFQYNQYLMTFQVSDKLSFLTKFCCYF